MSSDTIGDGIDQHVHTGLWTDWTNGAVLGRTLTMSRPNGNLLIAFTASFIAFVATRFWRTLCLAIHRCCSSQDSRDTLHGQRQVILRNSSSPENGLISFIRLSWAWRRLGSRRLLHLFFLSFLSAIIAAVFTVAGGFSSTISSAVGDVVLIDSSKCGFIAPSANTSTVGPGLMFISNQLSNAASYANQCYSSSSAGILGCSRFVRDKITVATTTNASCPFEKSLCRSDDSSIVLDTGPINTNDVLGLNAPERERSSIRTVLSCAPLVTNGYTSQQNTSVGNFVSYHYGQARLGPLENQTMVNYTIQTNDVQSQYSRSRDPNFWAGFNLRLRSQSSANLNGRPSVAENEGYIPLPGLQRPDGDTTVAFLSGDGVIFDQAADDDWYRISAPTTSHADPGAHGMAHSYRPEEAASPLGCLEQYQICNVALPNDSGCGPLAGYNDALIGAAPLFNFTSQEWSEYWEDSIVPPNNRAASRLIWLYRTWNYNPSSLGNLISQMGATSLASQSRLYDGTQYGLSTNQWQNDVIHWFDTILSVYQASYISTVIGPSDAALDDVRVLPDGVAQEEFCNSQKIRSSGYTSFSMFGLCFTYVTGGLIILASVIIEPILNFFYKKKGYQRYRQLEWTSNQQLQLHRLAHEPLGHGTWSRATKFVPITEEDEFLGELDISTDHPIIAKPNPRTEEDQSSHHAETLSGKEYAQIHEQMVADEGTSIEDQARDEAAVSQPPPKEDVLQTDTTVRISERDPDPQSGHCALHHS